MIATRIIDNDMGAVMKVPLTGVGTIHGLTLTLDFVTGQKENPITKKMEDVFERVTVPEFPMSLLEMLAADMGITRVTEHCTTHLDDKSRITAFVDAYIKWVLPINASGKVKY